MYLKSHTAAELSLAAQKGEYLWLLDTGAAGDDDILIGDSYESVEADVLSWLCEEQLPEGWTLERIDPQDLPAYLPSRGDIS